jgi:hypothetical protein
MDEPPKMKLAMAFEAAMVDAINRYVRDVLRAQGLISQEAFDQHAGGACLQAKYAIARESAARWAAFHWHAPESAGEHGEHAE